MSSLPAVDWPDDTLELMRLVVHHRAPLKTPFDQVRYPVTIPVRDPDQVDIRCPGCDTWSPAASWLPARIASIGWQRCPVCGAESPAIDCEERPAVSLLTMVLPVPPRHYPIAFDGRLQAVNAIAACRMARRAARQAGLDVA